MNLIFTKTSYQDRAWYLTNNNLKVTMQLSLINYHKHPTGGAACGDACIVVTCA